MAINEILYLAAVVFSVGASVVSTVIVRRKHKQTQQVDEATVENGKQDIVGSDKNPKVENFWAKLSEKLPQYIISAEQFYSQLVGKASGVKTGVQKLAQVLDKIKIDCLTAGVDYDEQKATTMVNGLIELTNNVNTNK